MPVGRSVLSLVAAGALASSVPAGARAQDAHAIPVGKAEAAVVRVTPYAAGNFALQVLLGDSVGDVRDEVARGQAATVSLGVLGQLLGALVTFPTVERVIGRPPPALPLTIPPPIKADSRYAHDVQRAPLVPAVPVGSASIGAGLEEAHADDAGTASSRVRLASLDVNQLLELGAGVTSVKVGPETVEATTSIASLAFNGPLGIPLLRLDGLTWHARQAVGERGQSSFTIGSATLAGQRIPLDSPGALASQLDTFNQAIAPSGFALRLPKATAGDTGAEAGPIAIDFLSSKAAAASIGPVYSALAPQLSAVLTEVQDQVPEAALPLLLANVVVGAIVGTGGATIHLGGASASLATQELPVIAPFDRGQPAGSTDLDGSSSAIDTSGGSFTLAGPARGSVAGATGAGLAGAARGSAAAGGPLADAGPSPSELAAGVPASRRSPDDGASGPLVVLLATAGVFAFWALDRARAQRRILLGGPVR